LADICWQISERRRAEDLFGAAVAVSQHAVVGEQIGGSARAYEVQGRSHSVRTMQYLHNPIADYLPSSTAQIDWFLRAYPLVMSHTCGVPPTAAMAAGRR